MGRADTTSGAMVSQGATWTAHIARHREPLDEAVDRRQRAAGPGGCLILVRSAESRTHWRRRIGPRHHVLTLSEAFGLLSPAAIEDDDLLPDVVTRWAILESLPRALRSPHREHRAAAIAREITLLEASAMRPPYPAAVRARLDPVSVTVHEAVEAMRRHQNARGRYTAGQRTTELAHARVDDVRRRLAARMPTVRELIVTDIAWLSPAERAALDRLGDAVGGVHVHLVARPPGSGDAWTALQHVDGLLDHMAGRGTVEDLGAPDAGRTGLLETLATPLPLSRQTMDDVHIGQPATMRHEVRDVATRIHDLVENGTDPDRIGIVVPDLEAYLGPLGDRLAAQGVPTSLRHHGHTLHTPAGTLLALLLLDAIEEGLERDAVIDWMLHPLVSLLITRHGPDGTPRVERFDAACIAEELSTRGLRPSGIDGPDGWRTALATLREPSVDAVRDARQRGQAPTPVGPRMHTQIDMAERLVDHLQRLQGADDGLVFIQSLRDLLAETNLPRNVQRHAHRAPDPQPLLVGYRQLVRLIDDIEAAYSVTAPPSGRPARIVRHALRDGLRSLELPLGGDPDHGVQIVGFRNAPDLHVDHVFLLGATDDALPPRGQTERTARQLRNKVGPAFPIVHIRPEHESRWILHRLLADATGTVHITAPKTQHGEERTPSVLVDELQDAYQLDDPESIGDRILTPLDLHEESIRRAVPLTPDQSPHTAAMRALVAARHDHAPPGIHTGALHASTMAHAPERLPLSGRTPVSTSRIERFARCGYRALIQHGLQLSRPLVRDDDLHRLDRGNLLHDIIDAYTTDGIARTGGPFHPDATDPAEHEALYAAAIEPLDLWRRPTPAWDAFTVQLLGGLQTERNRYRHHPPGLLMRVLEDITALPTGDGIIASEAAFGADDQPQVHLQIDGTHLALRGRIDRIDRRTTTGDGADTPGLRVIDYKGGNAPAATLTHDGIDFQLPLYLHAATTLHPDHHAHEGAYYSLKHPRNHKQDKGYGVKETGAKTSRLSRADDPEAFDRLLHEQTPARLGAMLDAEQAGRFPITWLEPHEAGCQYCDVRRICGMNPERQTERRLAARQHRTKGPGVAGYVADLVGRDPDSTDEQDGGDT